MSRAQHYLPSHCTGRGRTHGKKEQEGAREVDRATHEKDRQLLRDRDRERGREKVVQTTIPKIITTPNMQTYYFTIMLS